MAPAKELVVIIVGKKLKNVMLVISVHKHILRVNLAFNYKKGWGELSY